MRDRSPPRCTRARPPSCPAHRLAPRTPSLTAYKAFGRPRERNESSQDAAFLLCRVPVKHVNRDRTMRDKDSGPSGHHRWMELSSASAARVALACERCRCWSGPRMNGNDKRLRTQARSRNIRMINRGQTPPSERAIAKRYGHSHSLALSSTHRAIEPLRCSIACPWWCAVCGRCFGSGPTPLHHPLPHNPGTPCWHAGARDGRAGVGGGG